MNKNGDISYKDLLAGKIQRISIGGYSIVLLYHSDTSHYHLQVGYKGKKLYSNLSVFLTPLRVEYRAVVAKYRKAEKRLTDGKQQ